MTASPPQSPAENSPARNPEEKSRCEFCGEGLRAALVCDACGRPRKLASALTLDSFALLGLPRTFALSRTVLESAYLQASKRVHPDYHRAHDEDHATARRLTALINEAYATLKDPFRRAEYLLGADEGTDAPKPSREFLLEQFELRVSALDSGDKALRERIRQDMEARLAQARTELAHGFAELEAHGDDTFRDAGALRQWLLESSYYRGLLRDISAGDSPA